MENENLLKKEEKKLPVRDNYCSIPNLFFCWAIPFFYKRYKNQVTEDEIHYKPLEIHKSGRLGDKLEKIWLDEIRCNGIENASLKRALWKCYRFDLIIHLFVFIIIEFILKMSQPLLMGKLMDYYSTNQTDNQLTEIKSDQYYTCALSLLTSSFLCVLISHSYIQSVQHLGMRMRISCCSLIYRKSLKLTNSALGEITIGKMINLLSNDVNRFDMAAMHILQLCVAPFEAITVMLALYLTVGWTVLAGIAFLIVVLPLQMYIGKLTGRFRTRTATRTDYRIKLMNEIICGIQVIKMYAWEKSFAKSVSKARKLEIEQIKKTSHLKALNVSLMILINRFGIFLCVISYAFHLNHIDAKYVFVVTSFYVMLRQTITVHLPFGINSFSETKVSIERIKNFLISYEIENIIEYVPHPYGQQEKKEEAMVIAEENFTKPKVLNGGILMENVSVKWSESAEDFALSGANLKALPGELVAIIGEVGGGKTALFQTILQEIPIVQGILIKRGEVSYSSQEPWLFPSSIRQNILFGQPMNEDKYKQILEICCLEEDFRNLPHGDFTIVGEKGVLLSGGQKARVNLARAIYKDADIYLLDDPLSSVDVQVGRDIFVKLIKQYLKDKCTILTTHQHQYLKDANRVYVVNNGKINEIDVLEDKFLDGKVAQNQPLKKKQITIDAPLSKPPVETKEEQKTGQVSTKSYRKYLTSGGTVALISLPVLFAITQIGISGADYFLGLWVNLDSDGYPKLSLNFCIYFYGIVIIISSLVTILRSVTFFNFCMNSSKKLHDQMFSKIVKAPMLFFDTNPSGRILNRFSKDVGLIDEMMPVSAMDTFQIAFIALGTFLVIGLVNIWFLLPAIGISCYFYYMKTIFLASSRNLKRMEATTRSPVLTHTTSSLQGLTTIRVLKQEKILKNEFDNHQDRHTTWFYLFMSCNRAFAFWLDFSCVLFTAIVLITEILSDSNAGSVGLAITQVMGLTGAFQWGIRQWSELENQMTSVERIIEYSEIAPEAELLSGNKRGAFPENGRIRYESVCLKYSLNSDYVLRNVTFVVNPGEKVGIVGRTGAGKSSLISALFRLAPIEGKIFIDDTNIDEIPLQQLRSKISIIPQDPVLFSGTLRDNLDPFGEYQDDSLWSSLERVKLKKLISTYHPDGLSTKILEGGNNFSVGQRQLMCLARAILRNNKILVLDEATANVDPQTDIFIQTTVKKLFDGCTIFTIAHRLNSVMDSDKILVMDGGELVEFGKPTELLSNLQGHFSQFIQVHNSSLIDISVEGNDSN